MRSAASSKAPARASAAPRNSILAIDYGRARIGLAIADGEARIAQPLSTLERINRNEDMRRLREIVREHGVHQIIVGLPLRLDGTRGEMAEEAERFANRLRKQLGINVELRDERLTSWEAERLMEEELGKKFRESNSARKKNSTDEVTVDSMAAAVILREYLEKV
ncbi:MAG TPA: Holliday junction resolvase RuvX [Terriglobales bacterium]|nr:Holliday junction resolvase RuvX [Terriglobales bacterium]HUL14903.1 Holliday junction resolvase RuvX [Terriglobales bacterium]